MQAPQLVDTTHEARPHRNWNRHTEHAIIEQICGGASCAKSLRPCAAHQRAAVYNPFSGLLAPAILPKRWIPKTHIGAWHRARQLRICDSTSWRHSDSLLPSATCQPFGDAHADRRQRANDTSVAAQLSQAMLLEARQRPTQDASRLELSTGRRACDERQVASGALRKVGEHSN